jgi:hypothetical protein
MEVLNFLTAREKVISEQQLLKEKVV